MIIAIQGQRGSYHHQALIEYFGANMQAEFCSTFEEVFEKVDNQSVDYGMVASENSLYGSINDVYDLLLEHDLYIIGEKYLQIHHCLIASEQVPLNEITDVFSHHAAIGQCRHFLKTQLHQARIHIHEDTAGALRDVVQSSERTHAAIASTFATEQNGGVIIKRGIETNPENYTRFVLISKEQPQIIQANKTSIILQTTGSHKDDDQKPGSLYKALGFFAERNINLTKLESRPLVGKAWHYMFYIDFDAAAETKIVQSIFKDLKEIGCSVRVLGSYEANPIA